MTLAQVNMLLHSTGLPVAYRHFAEVTNPPFIAFYSEGADNMAADGVVYHSDTVVRIELYSDKKDLISEGKVEAALSGLFYTKDETYIEEEHLYEVIYTMEV